MASPDTPYSSDTPSSAPRWRRVLRRVLQGLGGAFAFVIALLLVVMLLLQTNWGAETMARFVARQVNPFTNATVEIGSVRGNWIETLELRDVNLVPTDDAGTTTPFAHIDTLRVRYQLPSLLRNAFHVQRVEISSPSAFLRQRPDSTWIVPERPPAQEEGEPDTTASSFVVRIDRVRVTGGQVTAQFYTSRGDSTLRVEDAHLAARDIALGTTLAGQLDTLGVDAVLPGVETSLQLQAAATLTSDRFTLDGLQLTSPNTNVQGEGTLRLPTTPDDTLNDVNFTLTTAPLSFQDIAPFVPGAALNPDEQLQMDVHARGTGRLIELHTDARLSTGGSFVMDASVTPSWPADVETTAPGPLRYQVSAQARDLGSDLLAPPVSTPPTLVNADLQIDLDGPALNQLSGVAAIHLFDTQLTGYAVRSTQMELRFSDGNAVVDGSGRFAEAAFAVNGTMAPFANPVTYDLQTQVSDLNIGTFAPESEQESALNARLQLTGTGLAPNTDRVAAQLDLQPSTINRQRIESGRFTVQLARDTLRYDAGVAFPDGRFAANGHAVLAEPLRYTVERGALESVPVAALVGDTTESALNGTFRLAGQALDPDVMQLEADVQMGNSYYGTRVLNEATTRVTLREGQLDVEADADLRGGRFALTAAAQPFTAPLVVQSAEGEFRAVNIGTLLQDTTQSSDLNGTFRLNGRGQPTDTGSTWDAHVALDTSRLNQQPLDDAALDATLEAARLNFSMQLDTPAGHTRFAGHARPFDAEPTYALTEGALRNLNIGALAGAPSATTSLNGTLALQGRGLEPTTMSLDMQLDLDASTLNQARVEQGRLEAAVEDGQGSLDGRLDFAQGAATVQGSMRPRGEQPSYRFSGRLAGVNAAALVGADTLQTHVSLGIEAEGEGFDPATLQLSGHITGGDSRYASLRLDTLDARVQMADGLLRVDTLLVHSNVATATGGGQVALYDSTGQYTSDLLVEASVTNLTPLRELLGAQQLALNEGRVEARVYGNPGTVRFDASVQLDNLVYNAYQLAELEAHVAGARGDTAAFSALEMRGDLGLFSYGDVSVANTTFNARYEDEQVDFTTSLTVDQNRNAQIAGLVDMRPDRQRVVLQTFDMQLGANQWTLLQETSIAYGDVYRVNNFLLYSGQQQIAADGVVNPDGQQSMIAMLENVEIASVTDLLGFQGLGGRLSGTLSMSGAAQSPQISGRINLGIRSSGEEVGQLEMQVDYDSLYANVEALLTHVDGSTLSMEGRVPADLRLAASTDTASVVNNPVRLDVNANAFSIGWVDPFLDPETVQDVTGELNASLAIRGTLDTPALSGNGVLSDGRLELPALGTTYDRINAEMDFTGEQVQLRTLSVRSSDSGRLEAEGTINLTELTLGAYDLTVTTDNFLAIDTREYRVRVDSDLEVHGTTRQPVVEGSARVESADIYFVAGAESETSVQAVQLTREDEQTLERRFNIRLTEAETTTFDTYEALALDMSVQFERDTWLRSRSNPTMDIQFTGDLDVQKQHFQDVQVFGTIEVIPDRSRVVQFGKEFQIDEGTLTFNGNPAEPLMDIRAVYQVRARASDENEAEIILSITGSPDDLNLALSSNPQMDTNNILSYLAVGRPADQLLSGGAGANGGEEQSLGERLVIGQAAGIIENLAASQLGLDVVRIEPTPDGSIFLTAGQYLSPRFYAGIQQSITDQPGASVTSNVPSITLEYELSSWLLFRSIYRNPYIQLNFIWESTY